MAKAKKTAKSKTSKKVVRVAKKSVLRKDVDNRLSIVLIVLALIIFVLAAISMGQ